MSHKILRLPAVRELTGLSTPTIYRLLKAGNFPVRVRLGPNSVGWYESDVLAWIDSRSRIATGQHRPRDRRAA